MLQKTKYFETVSEKFKGVEELVLPWIVTREWIRENLMLQAEGNTWIRWSHPEKFKRATKSGKPVPFLDDPFPQGFKLYDDAARSVVYYYAIEVVKWLMRRGVAFPKIRFCLASTARDMK